MADEKMHSKKDVPDNTPYTETPDLPFPYQSEYGTGATPPVEAKQQDPKNILHDLAAAFSHK